MQYSELGRTGLKVSRCCLGTMMWGSPQNDEAMGHAQMDYALTRGVNFWDTAEMYAIPPGPDTQGNTVRVDTEGTVRGDNQTKETAKRGGIGAGRSARLHTPHRTPAQPS